MLHVIDALGLMIFTVKTQGLAVCQQSSQNRILIIIKERETRE